MAEISIPLDPIHDAPWDAIRTELKEANQPVFEQVIRDALAGVELGAEDERIVAWLSGYDCPTVAVIASWLYRVRALAYEEPEVDRG